ncbi:MAG: BrnA antitoxin family protein [Deltaproteobacteria bacterium]|nr:BrnA antitoxin family protein [Deltaproteobacteria bacterium]
MRRVKKFPFERARRVTPAEVRMARKAIVARQGATRRTRGRPPKPRSERYRAISIRLHPRILNWAKREARRRGIGYQSVINQRLLRYGV